MLDTLSPTLEYMSMVVSMQIALVTQVNDVENEEI